MTRLYSLGFESFEEMSLFPVFATQSGIYASDVARSGGHVFAFQGNPANVESQIYLPVGGHSEIYMSFAVRTTAAPVHGYNILRFGTGTDASPFASQMRMRWLTGNQIDILRHDTVIATSAAGVAPLLNNWVHFQVWLKPLNNAALGRYVVKIEGTTVIDFTGDATNGSEAVYGVSFYNVQNTAGSATLIDDVIINNAEGANNNTYPGLARLQPIKLVANGSNNDLSRGGMDLQANYRQVRDPSINSFLQGEVDDYDLFTVDQPDLPDGATINNIIVGVAGKSNNGAGSVAAMVKAGATESDGSTQVFGTGITYRQDAWDVNPDTSVAWIEADLANLEIGAKIKG